MLTMLFTALLAAQAAPSVQDAGWLAGCWRSTSVTRTVTELWLPPEGGTMIGLSRTISAGRTIEHEFLLIREGRSGLEYVARPSGQSEAVFTSTSIRADQLVFENPAHDFPTRITYSKTDRGLLAVIDGMVDGTPRAVEFSYVAADCSR